MKAETQGSVYDFTGLTHSQKELLTFSGWNRNCGRKQPQKRTVEKLIRRGLIVERKAKESFMFYIIEYTVPLPVHMAWCKCCSQIEQRKEKKQ